MSPKVFHTALQELSDNDLDDPFKDIPPFTNTPDVEELCDFLLGQVIQGLIEDDKEETASIMLSCRLSLETKEYGSGNQLATTIHGPIKVLNQLQQKNIHIDFAGIPCTEFNGDPCDIYNRHLEEFFFVLALVAGPQIKMDGTANFKFQAEIFDIPSNWRKEMMEAVRKKGTTNQGLAKGANNGWTLIYQNLRFRSRAEVRIAEAFDHRAVMYFANCTARINSGQDRVNREPDFLVCHNGKWGALEVDGEPFHPPSRTVYDHERDRLFQKHGLKCIEHYDANRCYQEPKQVVSEFLDLLAMSG